MYERYRDIDGALKVFKDSIKESSNPSPYHFLSSICHYYNEDYDKAKASIGNVGPLLGLDPKLTDYHEGLTCYPMKYVKEIVGKEKEADVNQLSTRTYKPVNISLVIDVSGSMYTDRRLHRLKSSVNKIIEILRPTDRLSIIVFNHQIVFEQSNISAKDRENLKNTVNLLWPDGGTIFETTIEKAYKQVMDNYLPDGRNQIIVATDGEYREGKIALGQLNREIKSHADSVFFSVVGISQTEQSARIMSEWTSLGNGIYRPVTEWEPNTDAIINVLKIISIDETVKSSIVDGVVFPEFRTTKDSALYEKAEDHIARQAYAQALGILNKLTKQYSGSVLLFKRVAEIYQFYMTEYLRAIEEWEKLLRIDPRNSDAYANKGYCYARMGDFNSAIKSYDLSIMIGNDTRAHNNLGCANWKNQNVAPPHWRDIEAAKNNFLNASKNQDSYQYAEIEFNTGLVLLKDGSSKEAVLIFNEILEKDSLNADAYLLRGLAKMEMKNYSSAKKDIEQAIEFQNLPYGDK